MALISVSFVISSETLGAYHKKMKKKHFNESLRIIYITFKSNEKKSYVQLESTPNPLHNSGSFEVDAFTKSSSNAKNNYTSI